MAQPAYQMGTIAMDMLLERMDGQCRGGRREVVLSSQLVIRRSSGKALVPGARVDGDAGSFGTGKEVAAFGAIASNDHDAEQHRRVGAAARESAATSRGDHR
jgi:hypothetical protein